MEDTDNAALPLGIGSTKVLGFNVTAARVEHCAPIAYRLARDPLGALTLQGAYMWQKGSEGGIDWRHIPTVQL